jgi:hypothetical protein
MTADAGTFTLTGQAIANRMKPATAIFAAAGQTAITGRSYDFPTVDGNLRLERLNSTSPIVDPATGYPSAQFQRFWQRHCEAIENAYSALSVQVDGLTAAYEAAAQATQAASAANNAVVEVQQATEAAQEVVTQLQSGELNLPAITVGGKRFVNDDGELA